MTNFHGASFGKSSFQVGGDQHGKVIPWANANAVCSGGTKISGGIALRTVLDAKPAEGYWCEVVRPYEKIGYTNAGTVSS